VELLVDDAMRDEFVRAAFFVERGVPMSPRVGRTRFTISEVDYFQKSSAQLCRHEVSLPNEREACS
jgi:hypothetical protein